MQFFFAELWTQGPTECFTVLRAAFFFHLLRMAKRLATLSFTFSTPLISLRSPFAAISPLSCPVLDMIHCKLLQRRLPSSIILSWNTHRPHQTALKKFMGVKYFPTHLCISWATIDPVWYTQKWSKVLKEEISLVSLGLLFNKLGIFLSDCRWWTAKKKFVFKELT